MVTMLDVRTSTVVVGVCSRSPSKVKYLRLILKKFALSESSARCVLKCRLVAELMLVLNLSRV